MKEARSSATTSTPSTHSASPSQTCRSGTGSDLLPQSSKESVPLRRGASGALVPATRLLSPALGQKQHGAGGSEQTSAVPSRPQRAVEQHRPPVPRLCLQHIISMREMFGELDLKHDYRCDSPYTSETMSVFSSVDITAQPARVVDLSKLEEDRLEKAIDAWHAARAGQNEPTSWASRLWSSLAPTGCSCSRPCRTQGTVGRGTFSSA